MNARTFGQKVFGRTYAAGCASTIAYTGVQMIEHVQNECAYYQKPCTGTFICRAAFHGLMFGTLEGLLFPTKVLAVAATGITSDYPIDFPKQIFEPMFYSQYTYQKKAIDIIHDK